MSGAELHLVSVMPGFGMPIVAAHIPEKVRREAAERMERAMQAFIDQNCEGQVPYTVAIGKNWEEIVRFAEEWGADLIVVYHNRRREINEVFSRSCSQRVSDNAHCSVLRLRKIRKGDE
jgi:nucleotide-binding universal stress UspA family protein